MKIALSKKNLWEKTPRQLKETLGRALEILPPAWLLGSSFRENYNFVKQAQWWSDEHNREYQLSRLREIITVAYEKTQFYRKKYDLVGFSPKDLKSLENINNLPIINKQDVIDNQKEMCTKDINDTNVDYVSTGGTSGTPLHFFINANRSASEYAYLINCWERIGFKLGMPMAVLRGKVVKPNRRGFHYEYDPILRHHYYSNFHMSNENIKQYLEHIRKIGECILHAYPSSAQRFVKFIIETGQEIPRNIKAVILESENVYPDQINDIENILKVRTFSSYGHSEKCVLACQCEYSHDYHVWPTYGYFELLDENDNPVNTPGQEGEIVGTGFINTVMPFIRYRTGDYATYVNNYCKFCKRNHTVITNIKGRERQQDLIANDGSLVSVIGLHPHDDTFRNVREYQFYQSEPGKAFLCLVPINALDDNEKQRIVNNMNKRLQGQVMLEIKIKKELFKTAIGKQPRIIQECNISETN